MKRRLMNGLLAAAALAAITSHARATDGIICNCDFCSGCVCGDSSIFGFGCGDCGYMLPAHRANCYNWDRGYAHSAYGQPVALVVPPTANLQTNWGWGVASSRVTRLEHQVRRNYPGPGPWGGPGRRTPAWPSDTTQLGVYYVRGPW
jgi:hypothetical protein